MSAERSGPSASPPTVAVIGGGFAGLVVAREITQRSQARVVVHEAAERLGGKVLTTEVDGIRVEAGPDSFLDRDGSMSELCTSLGLGEELIPPAVFGGRVAIEDRLERLPSPSLYGMPTSPKAALACRALSLRGRARAAAEPSIPALSLDADVSVGQFVRWRFGVEVLERLVDPLLAGTRAGDVHEMSLMAALPQVYDVVKPHGSVMRGIATAGDPVPSTPPFLSLRSGMQTLIEALKHETRRVEVRLGDRIESVSDHGDYYDLVSSSKKMTTADFVVLCVPTFVATRLLANVDRRLVTSLDEVEYASSASIALAYPPASVPVPADASGVLVPSSERRTISGLTYFTAKWPHLAPPDGRQVVRCFVGRSGHHPALDMDDDDLVRAAGSDLAALVGVRAEPLAHQVTRWERGMPQYTVGHLERVATASALLAEHPRLALAGAGLRGTGLPDVAKSARRAADRIARGLEPTGA